MRYRLDPGQIEVVDDAVAAILRKKTPAERAAMVFRYNRRMRIAVEGPSAITIRIGTKRPCARRWCGGWMAEHDDILRRLGDG